MRVNLPSLLRVAVVALMAGPVSAQSMRPQDLGIGKFLVASRASSDESFAKTVIVLARYENTGTVGLIVNRPTKVSISKALEGNPGAKQRVEPIYFGGPVGTTTVFALFRANVMPDGATHVSGKVHMATSETLLKKILASRTSAMDLRVYAGYAGWSKSQLEYEVERGLWYIFPANPDLIFDSQPETLWSRLIARLEQRVAEVRTPISALAGR